MSARNDGATVIAADNPCPDKPFATDLLIAFNQRDPRDPTQGYIRAGDFGFVGFGAGTLSDMQLTLLLMLQVSPYYPTQVQKLLCTLPAPPTTPSVDDFIHKRTRLVLSRRRFRLFVNPAFYLILLLLLSGDIELNPGPLTEFEMELLKSLQSGQTTIMQKLDSIDLRFAKMQ